MEKFNGLIPFFKISPDFISVRIPNVQFVAHETSGGHRLIVLGDETNGIRDIIELVQGAGDGQYEDVFDVTTKTKSQGLEEGVELISVEFPDFLGALEIPCHFAEEKE